MKYYCISTSFSQDPLRLSLVMLPSKLTEQDSEEAIHGQATWLPGEGTHKHFPSYYSPSNPMLGRGRAALSGKQVVLEFLPRKGRAPWLCSAYMLTLTSMWRNKARSNLPHLF